MLFLSVTEAGEAGALDLVSTTAWNRRIFAWRKTDLDLCVLSRVRRPDGRDEFSASCESKSVDGDRPSRSRAETSR
jgi:hypothetical protein